MKCERCGSSEAFLDTEWGSRCGKSPALSPGKLRHDADWRSSGERIHGLEGIAEIALVRIALDEADMRRRQHARIGEERVVAVVDRLRLEDVDRGVARTSR